MDSPNKPVKTFGSNLNLETNPGFEYKIDPRTADMVCIIAEDNNVQERG